MRMVTQQHLERTLSSAMQRTPEATRKRIEWLDANLPSLQTSEEKHIVREMKKQGLYSPKTRNSDARLDYLLLGVRKLRAGAVE